MKRTFSILCCLLFACGFFWLFPLFHVVRIEQATASQRRDSFNAAEFASEFWTGRLLPSLDQAADAATVLDALRNDSNSARNKLGRKVGLGRTRLVVLRGTGKIVTLDTKGVGIAFESSASTPDIILQRGLLFGNTVRDATGLLDASTFPNSQHFNEVSTELNRIVEARVYPALSEPAATLEQQVQFVGCVGIPDDGRVDIPLMIIPLAVRVQKPIESPLLSDSPNVPR